MVIKVLEERTVSRYGQSLPYRIGLFSRKERADWLFFPRREWMGGTVQKEPRVSWEKMVRSSSRPPSHPPREPRVTGDSTALPMLALSVDPVFLEQLASLGCPENLERRFFFVACLAALMVLRNLHVAVRFLKGSFRRRRKFWSGRFTRKSR